MAKTPLNGNLKYVLGVIGLIITVASVYTSVVLAVSGVANTAEQNTKDIIHNQENGCDPYNKIIAPKIVGIERDIAGYEKDIKEIKETQQQILAILLGKQKP